MDIYLGATGTDFYTGLTEFLEPRYFSPFGGFMPRSSLFILGIRITCRPFLDHIVIW